MLTMEDFSYEWVMVLEGIFNNELEHQENLSVYREDAVNYFEHRDEYFFLGKNMGLNMVYEAMFMFVDKFSNTEQYLIGEQNGGSASGRLPVCLEVVRYLTQKIERHINDKIRRKFIYKLDGPFRHLHIDMTQYTHSWSIVSLKGEWECLGMWIESTSKIPDCGYLEELFKRYMVLKIIKVQAIIRRYLN
jgi:hypothetical protein